MTEKVPCPVCARPMKPRHTKGTDFMPRHNNPQGERCSGTTAVVNAKPRCEDCGQTTCHKAPVSDPAPTVEDRDDAAEGNVNDTDLAKLDDAFGTDYDKTEGPWLGADEPGTCGTCDDPFAEGDSVRWDGIGAWQCRNCGGDDLSSRAPETQTYQQQAREAAARHLTSDLLLSVAEPNGMHAQDAVDKLADEFMAALPTPDEFLDPATPEVKLNVSGQPEARRDWQKRYIVVDPDLGDFRRTVKERKPKGITRATTFNKAAQNTTHLNLWGKANVARGASLRPDILRRAHGLTWEDHKDELLLIVDELETAAGAKVPADEGSFLHEFCDQVDAGLKTWEDAPAAYQQDIRRYVEALAEEGLEPVPGLIERTTFIREYGGVAGTFDRIFYHRPSGQYIVGDLKTGKTMSYAMDETECQIWTYAHGVNQTGIYDWNTDTWSPTRGSFQDFPITVSEKVGVIVHMPVQGKEAGEVYLRYADLECGRAYAELNHAVRSYPKSKVRPFVMPSAAPERESRQDIGGGVEVRHSVVDVPAPERPWEAEFRGVRTGEDANALWRQAKAAGIKGERLAALVDLARQSIRIASWSQRQGLPSSPL